MAEGLPNISSMVVNGRGRPRIGFIGIGNQGGPIARRIGEAGWPLTLWAGRPEAIAPFVDIASTSESPESLAAESDIICLCLVDDAGVAEIFDRILPAMRRGGLIAILSTIHPDSCVRLAERAAAACIALIDAPVSGGAEGAAAGTLTVMMGGSDADCARAVPVFKTFGGLVLRMGDVGAGQRAKLLNNALLTALMDATQDARETGAMLGLDPDALDQTLAASSGSSFALGVLRRLPSLAALTHGALLLRKDVGLLHALCEAKGIATPEMIGTGLRFLDRVERAS